MAVSSQSKELGFVYYKADPDWVYGAVVVYMFTLKHLSSDIIFKLGGKLSAL